MQIKGLEYVKFSAYHTHKLTYCKSLSNTKLKNNYLLRPFVGYTIAFSTCNKPFKTLGIPKERMKSCEGLTEILPTNIYVTNILSSRIRNDINNVFYSLTSLN
jgi:hypothetical protein